MRVSLWNWCLGLSWLPLVYSNCNGISNFPITIHPQGTIRLPYGESLEIFCQDDMHTADDLEFAIGGVFVPSDKLNATTRRLNMEDHKKGTFTYYCRNKVTKKRCTTRVLVDTAPQNVTDFNCKSLNLDILNCTWINPEVYSNTNYSLSLLKDGYRLDICNSLSKGRLNHCTWTPTSRQHRYRQLDRQFIFQLQLCNTFGCNEQNFTIDHYSIVKPDPPSHFKVLRNGTHSVLLQWSIPNNMVDFLPNGVDHRIEYQIAKIDNTSYFRKVDTSGLPVKNKTYKYLLSDLPYAHMQYEVRIYIRPKEAVKDEFWSDFNYIVFYTASERPNRSPDTVVGAFDQNKYETKRRIFVYWKQLEEYEEAGANFTYKVVAQQKTGNPKTLLGDNKTSLSYVVLEDASLEAINVEIWSNNDNGTSLNSSRVYIPPYTDSELLKITDFTMYTFGNGTHKLAWSGIINVDNYTLFWCERKVARVCTGSMDFKILESDITYYVVHLPREKRYQFAISANKGIISSGMVWVSLEMSEDAVISYRPFTPLAETPLEILSLQVNKKRCHCHCSYDSDFITD